LAKLQAKNPSGLHIWSDSAAKFVSVVNSASISAADVATVIYVKKQSTLTTENISSPSLSKI